MRPNASCPEAMGKRKGAELAPSSMGRVGYPGGDERASLSDIFDSIVYIYIMCVAYPRRSMSVSKYQQIKYGQIPGPSKGCLFIIAP